MPLYCIPHTLSRPACTVYFHCSAVLTLYYQSCFWSSFWSLIFGCHWRRAWGQCGKRIPKGDIATVLTEIGDCNISCILEGMARVLLQPTGYCQTIRIVQHRKKPFDLEIFHVARFFTITLTYLDILLVRLRYITYLAIFAYLQYSLIYGRYYTRSDFTNIHSWYQIFPW